LTGTSTPQPATPPMPFGGRQGPTRGIRVARRGNAVLRMAFLIAFSGLLVATIVAAVFAGLVIAINGRLP
jgi:hypothetical protein